MTGAHAADSLTPLDAEPGGLAGQGGGKPDSKQAGGGAPVVLRFAPLPEHVRTARLVAVALARRAGVEDGLLDEVRLAVGEACSRAVGLHRSAAPAVPVVVRLDDGRERFGVEVVDAVSGGPVPKPEEEGAAEQLGSESGFSDDADSDMGLAVLRGLVDDLEVEVTASGGVIRMGWPVITPHWVR
ncbi:ATP-binding protein [Actinocrinis puniceicyclus]|uniref:ATP-binding protein n=1 Tax=Actinocrinis puniceicyclus TaxID=977794 RepID=A0A8J8BAB4_9ACTN|nr:ATP-binding protein [Actinocrinis puniceicyclus]MBS2962782.1 ATP-binding protein [Actinocrinis puniceicyclus]